MNEAIKVAKENGHNDIEIMVNDKESKLMDWYERLGFNRGKVYRSMWKRI